MITTYEEFFNWCDQQGLRSDRLIATAFGMTPQTVRNWKIKLQSKKGKPPLYLSLACTGYEITKIHHGEIIPNYPAMSIGWFKKWREEHSLTTLEKTGDAFGITRQAVHNWVKRESLPRWLALACLGFEQRIKNTEIDAIA